MRAIRTEIEIDAPARAVWDVMSDLDAWPTWSDVIPAMVSRPRLGGSVDFRIRVDGLPTLRFRATIREWERDRAIAWGAGLPGVFTGHHYFRLSPDGEKKTRLLHGEDFRGVLPELGLRGALAANLERTYDRLNRQLKDRVERG